MNEVSNIPSAVVSRPPRSVLGSMSEHYGMEPAAFEATLRATVVPEKISREQFAAFLLVANQYGLNPILKEIYAFPTRSGGIQPIVGVDGWANLINSHPACDGVTFDDEIDADGNLVAITCKIFRKDRQHPTTATEYMEECRRNTDTWRQWPRRMLRHKALIQAARYAFGFSGIIEPDEWERSPENPETPKPKRQPATVVQAIEHKPLPPVVGEPRLDPEAEIPPTTSTNDPATEGTSSAAVKLPAAEGERAAGTIPSDESTPPASTDTLIDVARMKATAGKTIFKPWFRSLSAEQKAELEPLADELRQRMAAS